MKSNCFPGHKLKVGDYVICRKTPAGYPADLIEGKRYTIIKTQNYNFKINNGRWYDFTYFIPDVLTNERKDKLKRLLK